MLEGAAVMQLCQMGGPVLGRMSSVWEHGLAIAVGVERFWCNRVEVFCNALEEVGWPQPKTPIQMETTPLPLDSSTT